MFGIPEIKCPKCGTPMEYSSGPSDSNIFTMTCLIKWCGYQGTYYVEAKNKPAKEISIPCRLNRASLGEAEFIFAVIPSLSNTKHKIAYVPRKDVTVLEQPIINQELNGKLKIRVESETNDTFYAMLINGGTIEIVEIAKNRAV